MCMWSPSDGNDQLVTETSSGTVLRGIKVPVGKGRTVGKADNLTTICEPTVSTKCGRLDVSTLWASTACYRDKR
jgi:hypothetical protein